MKMGRLSNEKLNDASALLAASLEQRPACTVALVIVPYPVSAHVRSGPFGELKSFGQHVNTIVALTVFPWWTSMTKTTSFIILFVTDKGNKFYHLICQ